MTQKRPNSYYLAFVFSIDGIVTHFFGEDVLVLFCYRIKKRNIQTSNSHKIFFTLNFPKSQEISAHNLNEKCLMKDVKTRLFLSARLFRVLILKY